MLENNQQGQQAQTQDPTLEALISQVTDPNKPPETPPEPKPITVNIGGQNYQFKDEAELSSQLTQYVQNLQQQQQQQQTQYVSGKEDDTPKPDAWSDADMKEYVRLMGTNPIQAQNYLDKKRFGVEDPIALIKSTAEENQKLQRTITAIQFKEAHPDLPFNPQLANILEQRRTQLGVPFTYEGLEASYWSLVGTGMLPPPQRFQQPQPNQQGQMPQQGQQHFAGQPFTQRGFAGQPYNQQNYGGAVQPPPSIPRSAPDQNVDYDMASRFENMDRDQLAKVLTEYQNRMNQGR